jgi:hypothetical protein
VISVHGLQHEFLHAMATLEKSGNLNYVCRKYVSNFSSQPKLGPNGSQHSQTLQGGKKTHRARHSVGSVATFVTPSGKHPSEGTGSSPFQLDQLSEHFPTFSSSNSPSNGTASNSSFDHSSRHSSPSRSHSVGDGKLLGDKPALLWSDIAQRPPSQPRSISPALSGTSMNKSSDESGSEKSYTRNRSQSHDPGTRTATFSEVAKSGRSKQKRASANKS